MLFSPFFLSGKVLIASTDNYYYIFPNLIFGRRYLAELQFFPWNSYLLAGVDFSSSNYNFMYSPYYWLMYLVPENYFFQAFTIVTFVSVWLLGVFAYLFFAEELQSKKWGLFTSTVFQLCEHLFFSLNTYPFFVGVLFSTIAAYLIWTLHKRASYVSYPALTSCLAVIFLSCHIIRAFMLTVLLCILFLYRWRHVCLNPLKLFTKSSIFYLSLLTAVLIAMIRLVPLVYDAPASDRLQTVTFTELCPMQLSLVYNSLGAMVPEMLGVRHFTQSPLGPGIGHNVYFLTYAGVLPFLLVVYAIIRRGEKPWFWIVLWVVAAFFQLRIRPVSDLLLLFFYPAFHAFVLKIVPAFAFCALAGYGAKYLETDIRERRHEIWMSTVLSLVLCLVLVYMAFRYESYLWIIKLSIIGTLLITPLLLVAQRRSAGLRDLLAAGVPAISLAAVPIVWYFAGSLIGNAFARTSFVYISITLVSVSWLWVLVLGMDRFGLSTKASSIMAVVLLAGTLAATVYPWPEMVASREPDDPIVLSMVGIWRFLLITAFLGYVVQVVRDRELSVKILFPAFVCIVIMDLLPFDKIYGNRITTAFWSPTNIEYPLKLDQAVARLRTGFAQKGQNVLINGTFDQWDGSPIGWHVNSPAARASRGAEEGIASSAGGVTVHVFEKNGNIFQDVKNRAEIKDSNLVASGAWVKTSTPGSVRILLTTSDKALPSLFHSGSGKWEWLSTGPIVFGDREGFARIHVMANEPSTFQVKEAVLAIGGAAFPSVALSEDEIPRDSRKEGERPRPSIGGLDLKRFRVAASSNFIFASSKTHYTHIPYLYGFPSFGGVNGFRSPYFLQLYNYFQTADDPRAGAGAHIEYLKNPRFLDLMGCGYERSEDSYIVRRPNALSRVMLFKNFEVIESGPATLQRLKDPDFDPRRTLILASHPRISSAQTEEEATDLDFNIKDANTIQLTLESDSEAVLLFNDTYDKGWKAFVNGRERPIYRANHNFMATTTSPGRNDVVLRFLPSHYLMRLVGTVSGLFLFVSLSVVLLFVGRSRNASITHQENRQDLADPHDSHGRS